MLLHVTLWATRDSTTAQSMLANSITSDTTTRTTALRMDMLGVRVCTPAYSSCALSLAHVYMDTTSSSSIVAPVSQVATVPDTTTCKREPVIVPR